MVAEADEVGNISDDLVVTKYKMAAEITNSEYKSSSNIYKLCPDFIHGFCIRRFKLNTILRTIVNSHCANVIYIAEVLKEVVDACKTDASVRELCMLGDKRLTEETGKAFKKDKKLTKGIAFPTCLSVNHIICHFSPLVSEPDLTLAEGDMVKIDMGAHIDGFIAVVAHTVVVGGGLVTGPKADALMAAHLCSEAALRLVKPGNETYEITETVSKIAEAFECKVSAVKIKWNLPLPSRNFLRLSY